MGFAAALAGCTADAWLTPDQQGRRLLEAGDAAQAAERFADPAWRATACYRAADYACAIDAWALVDSPEAAFNAGNAHALAEQPELALEAYDRALAMRPGWTEAEENRALVQRLVEAEPPEEEEEGEPRDPTFDADQVKFDEKGEQGKRGEIPRSAMTEEAITQMWLRAVEPSPGDFLRLKFADQAARQAERP